jgi:CrcB protein
MPFRRQLQLAVVTGGVVGCLVRAGLTHALPWDDRSWPWVTFGVNVAGAFLLGLFVTRLQERLPPSSYSRPLLGTGFCGAMTTFSTVQVELIVLARHHRPALAAAYLGASLAAGLGAVYLGTALARNSRLG